MEKRSGDGMILQGRCEEGSRYNTRVRKEVFY